MTPATMLIVGVTSATVAVGAVLLVALLIRKRGH
jgi:hypothetical protein